MRANRGSIIFYFALSCATVGNNYCEADYIGHFPTVFGPAPFQVTRVRDDGTLTSVDYGSSIPNSVRMGIESYGEEAAVTPDLKKVYQFTNTLGFSSIIASDANTGQYLAADSFGPPSPIFQAKQPLIAGNNELFVLSRIQTTSGPESWEIKHFDLTTKSFIESISPTTPQKIDDIAFVSGAFGVVGDNLYFSTPSGIYEVFRTATNFIPQIANFPAPLPPFGSLVAPLISNVDGNIAIGPDNRLYVRNFANGDVQRYSLTGTFIDTFLSHTKFPNLGTIQFGVDGNLHVYQSSTNPMAVSNILTFSPLSGSVLAAANNTIIYPGRVTFVPVPEPTTAMLFAVVACCVTIGHLAKR